VVSFCLHSTFNSPELHKTAADDAHCAPLAQIIPRSVANLHSGFNPHRGIPQSAIGSTKSPSVRRLCTVLDLCSKRSGNTQYL
jgi:hypothetical protein